MQSSARLSSPSLSHETEFLLKNGTNFHLKHTECPRDKTVITNRALYVIINRLQLKYYKLVLGLKQRTPSCMVYGELGELPVDISVRSRVLIYWAKIINEKTEKFSNIIYRLLFVLHQRGVYSSKWILTVEKWMNDLGMTNIWLN